MADEPTKSTHATEGTQHILAVKAEIQTIEAKDFVSSASTLEGLGWLV
jgi:hypothetical protein